MGVISEECLNILAFFLLYYYSNTVQTLKWQKFIPASLSTKAKWILILNAGVWWRSVSWLIIKVIQSAGVASAGLGCVCACVFCPLSSKYELSLRHRLFVSVKEALQFVTWCLLTKSSWSLESVSPLSYDVSVKSLVHWMLEVTLKFGYSDITKDREEKKLWRWIVGSKKHFQAYSVCDTWQYLFIVSFIWP